MISMITWRRRVCFVRRPRHAGCNLEEGSDARVNRAHKKLGFLFLALSMRVKCCDSGRQFGTRPCTVQQRG